MSPRPVRGSGGVHMALASSTRRRLLELLRGVDTARDVHELAEAVGLHPSTVRFHLETLRKAGLVTRRDQRSSGAGRPRTAYVAIREGSEAGYERLARMLAADVAQTARGRAGHAEGIGERWAQQMIPLPTAPGTTLTDDAVAQVSSMFERLGFEPQTRGVEGRQEISLHGCPFRSVAREHPDVVCAIHLGLLRGSLERLGAHTTSRLRPFVEPNLCVAEVTTAS
ncbi:MAG: ArsR family transcriptional regulator [Humibacillus sp.]|nr:ArsR family transcriptional regulator [Humibacillus sp.]MDN5779304.1 ArsR family transcriptional regulator [Humibacillus sp.]